MNRAPLLMLCTLLAIPLVPAQAALSLKGGLNLVGFHPVGAAFRAHDLLRRLGDPDVVTSVGRFDRDSGRFVTATRSADGPSGPNFVIRAGDGLLIAMRQPVTGFSVPASAA